MDLALTGGGKCAAEYEEKIYWKWTVTSECSSKSSPRRSHLNSDLNEERTESCANPATSDIQMGECFGVHVLQEQNAGIWASQVALVVKKLPAMQESQDTWVWSLGRRSPGEGSGTPLQYSCRENPMDSGVLWATFHRVTKSQMRLKRISTHNADIQKDGVWDTARAKDCQVSRAIVRSLILLLSMTGSHWSRKVTWADLYFESITIMCLLERFFLIISFCGENALWLLAFLYILRAEVHATLVADYLSKGIWVKNSLGGWRQCLPQEHIR